MLPAFWVASSPTLTAIPSPVETVSSICLAPVTAATIPVRPDACWSPGAGSTAPPRSPPRSRGTPCSTSPRPCRSGWTTPCGAIAEAQQLATSAAAAPFAAAQAAQIVVAQRPDAKILALWLADAVLAALR